MESDSTSTTGAASLRRAVREGDLAAARALIASDSSLARTESTRGGSLILEAHERDYTELADFLLSARDGGSLVSLDVHEAAALGRPAALKHVFTNDVTAIESNGPAGFQPLHRAAFRGHAESTALLLEMGADPQARADNGPRATPLECAVAGAARFGADTTFGEVVRLLLAAGADPDAPSQAGVSAREDASRRGLDALFVRAEEVPPPEGSAADGTPFEARPS